MVEVENRKKFIQAYAKCLARYPWSWHASLKIAHGVSTDVAAELFHDWICELDRVDGGSDFRWVRITERIRNKQRFHVLVGGLRNQHKEAARRWRYLGGEALIERFVPDGDVIPKYLLRTMGDSGHLDFDSNLPNRGLDVERDLDSDESIERAPEDVQPTTLLRVGNLSPEISIRDLWVALSRYARVFRVRMDSVANNTFAFVDVGSEDAEDAVCGWDGRKLHGNRLRVERVTPDTSW